MHLLPGPRPLVLLVHGSQLYEVDPELFARLEAGEPEASVELRALSDAARPPEGTRTPLPAPASVSLNLAQACNLACHYCYADEGRFQGDSRLMPEHVALAAIDRALEEARGARITLGFIGGEPFLNRAVLHRSVAHARARAAGLGVQVGFSLTTNGTLLRPEDLELLRDNPFAVTVSLDGDAAMHDRHRPARDGRGSHARAMEALAPLLAAPGRARVVARATVTRDDLRVAERVAALLDAGFQEAGVSPVRTGPDAALPLRREDWGPFLAEMIRAAEAELTRVRARRGEEPLRFSNLGIALKEIHRGACRPLPCGAAQGYVSVSAEGRYFTCHRTIDDPRFALGDLSRGPDAGARKRFVLARHVDRQEPCRSCWARYLCGGGCHAEVVSAGREGCDYIRGWLEFCLRAHNDIASELPQLLVNAKEGAS
jgi:uncharacterized protein